MVIVSTIGQNLAKENQDFINDMNSEFNQLLEPYAENVDLNSNNQDYEQKLYDYGMDLAKELDAMLSEMNQPNAKIYKISKPRYTLNDYWTNLDHDMIKKADLYKVKLFMLPRRKKFSMRNLTGSQMKYLLKDSQRWKPRTNTKFGG